MSTLASIVASLSSLSSPAWTTTWNGVSASGPWAAAGSPEVGIAVAGASGTGGLPESSGLSVVALWLVTLGPAVVGALLCLVAPARRVACAAGLATAAAVVGLAVLVAVQQPAATAPFVAVAPFAVGVDDLSAVVLVTVSVVALLVLVFAVGDVTEAPARFHGLMLIFVSAVALTVTAQNLLTLLIAWEVMGATSYALIGFRWRDPATGEAGMVAFVTTRAADIGLYIAAGAALAGGAGLGLGQLTQASSGWRDVMVAGLVVAALGKAAQLPFSFWLGRAMAGPSAVSALLHSAAMVAMGGYLLLRVADLLQVTGWAATTVAWAGALTALSMGAVAVLQSDLKQLLAASTAAQIGFIVMAAGIGAVAGGTAHLVAHAATKALLFLVAGAWLSGFGTKKLAELGGAARRWPGVGVMAVIGLLSLAGVAPLALWASKDAVLAVAGHQSAALYAVGLVAAALSAAYAAKVLLIVLAARTRETAGTDPADPAEPADRADLHESAAGSSGRVSSWTWAALPVLAAGSAVLGAVVLMALHSQARTRLEPASTPVPGVGELVVSGSLAVAVLALMTYPRRRARRARRATAASAAPADGPALREPAHEPLFAGLWPDLAPHHAPSPASAPARRRYQQALASAGDWLTLERVAQTLLVSPTLRLAHALDALDRRVLDRGVDACAVATVRLAERTRFLDDRGVDGVVEAVGRGARRLGELARRPQTGQLHQYYAQVAGLLAVGLVLLIVIS